MRYLAALLVVFLVGCDDPVEPRERRLYEVETLKILSGDPDVVLVDLNENGQARWNEGTQGFLWDNGVVHELPFRGHLGPSGEVVGSALWEDGEITDLPGRSRGITEDGTIYLSRNDTMFTWKDGVLEATDLPVGLFVGAGGRVFSTVPSPSYYRDLQGTYCIAYEDGQWDTLPSRDTFCRPVMGEENGWSILTGGHEDGNGWVATPSDTVYDPWPIGPDGPAHVNAHGEIIGFEGRAVLADTSFHVGEVFGFDPETLKGGAINDLGDILLLAGDSIVLLKKL